MPGSFSSKKPFAPHWWRLLPAQFPAPFGGKLLRRLGVGLGLGFALALAGCDGVPPFHNTDLSGAPFAREFPAPLVDHRGQPRRLADFQGQVVILFFGYTTCPDVCPTSLSRFAQVLADLGMAGEAVQVLFVSVDPQRDTAARLADYVPWFHPRFLALRPEPEALPALLREFRVVAVRQEVGGGLGYLIDHTAGAYVYDRQGKLRLLLADQAPLADIEADLRRLLEAGGEKVALGKVEMGAPGPAEKGGGPAPGQEGAVNR